MNIFNSKTLTTLVPAAAVALATSLLPFPAQAFDYPAPGNYALGAQQWVDNCTRCHNLRGPNELRDDQWITTMFHMRLRAGLTGEQTRNILTFLQGSNNSLAGESIFRTSAAVSSASSGLSGKAIFDQTCIACHGAGGKGALPGVPDLTRKGGRLSKSDDQLFTSVTRGLQSPGATMAMPPRGGNDSLTEDDIRSVIEYMHSKFGS